MNIGRKYEKNQKKGRRTVGSGNKWFDKGDLELDKFLCELKATEKESFSVKNSYINKIKKEADALGKYWALKVEIGGKEVVVVDAEFLDVLDASEEI